MLVEKIIKADFCAVGAIPGLCILNNNSGECVAPTAQILFSGFYSTDMLPPWGKKEITANKNKCNYELNFTVLILHLRYEEP